MRHDRAHEERLIAYADGILDQADALEAHLAQCPRCQARVADYRSSLRRVVEGIAPTPPGEAPSPALLRGPVTPPPAARPMRRWAYAGATACALLVAAGMLWRPTHEVAPEYAMRETQAAFNAARIEVAPEDAMRETQVALNAARIEVLLAELAQIKLELKRLQTAEDVMPRMHEEEIAAITVAAGAAHEARGDLESALERYRYAVSAYPDTDAAARADVRLAVLRPQV